MAEDILVVPDSHAHPDFNNERADWLGKFILDRKPDVVVNMGDTFDMPSLSSYDKGKASFHGASYEKDINAGIDFLDRMWHPIKKAKKKRPYSVFLEGNHCVPEDTDVLVEGKGWVNIRDVEVSDYVMSLEGWSLVEETHEVFYGGNLYKFGDRSSVSYVTEDHRVYYYNGSGNLVVKPAKDAPESLDLPVSIVTGDGVDLSDAQLRFIAVAMTDSYHTGSGGLVFYQSGKKADYIESIIKACGVPYRKVARDRDITHICGKKLKSTQTSYEFHMAERPEWCVDNNKSVPDWCFNLSESQFETLLEVLIFCDGSIPTRNTNSLVFYGQKKICEGLQAVLVTKGFRATITEYREGQFRVNICKTYKCRANKSVYKENYNGFVYCLTTQSGSFLMRQENKPVFTGNCHRLKKVLEYQPELSGDRFGVSYKNYQLSDYHHEVVHYEGQTPGIYTRQGISFAHFLVSGLMGRPIGGEHHAASLLAKNHCSCVVAHSHTLDFSVRSSPTGNRIMGLVAGVYQDYKSPWAGNVSHLWWSGVVYLRGAEDGIYDPEFISLGALRGQYGV
jgi:hypothetical protein